MSTETTKLSWDEDGQIGCAQVAHAPRKGTDTWRSGRWRAVTTAEAAAFEREMGHRPQCEACAATEHRKGVAS